MNSYYLSKKYVQSGFCLLVSLALSGFLWAWFTFCFDEMHIISTDHQYMPHLTFQQVLRDVFLLCLIYNILLLMLVEFIYWITIVWSGEKTKFKRRMALSCWAIMNVGILIAAITYLVKGLE